MIATRLRRYLPAAAFATWPLAAAPAAAADASAWDGDARAGARLIAAGDTGAARSAGIEIRLAPEWKTYWRYPGDSGVPPRFDWAGSQNVRAVHVLWPAPQRFSDGGGHSIGYKGNVILPVVIEPQDAYKPSRLHLALDYAVCEKLCVPAEAKVDLAIGGPSSHGARLAAARGQVPALRKLGEAGPLTILSLHREASVPHDRVTVDVTAPDDADLFAEGPTEAWALPVPQPAPNAPTGVKRFAFDLDGVPQGAAVKGVSLRLTLTAAGQAIEVDATLD